MKLISSPVGINIKPSVWLLSNLEQLTNNGFVEITASFSIDEAVYHCAVNSWEGVGLSFYRGDRVGLKLILDSETESDLNEVLTSAPSVLACDGTAFTHLVTDYQLKLSIRGFTDSNTADWLRREIQSDIEPRVTAYRRSIVRPEEEARRVIEDALNTASAMIACDPNGNEAISRSMLNLIMDRGNAPVCDQLGYLVLFETEAVFGFINPEGYFIELRQGGICMPHFQAPGLHGHTFITVKNPFGAMSATISN